MQVFSEPDHISNSETPGHLDHHRSSLEQVHHVGQSVDNTYATIQPRNNQNRLTGGGGGAGGGSMRSGGGASAGGVGGAGLLLARVDPHHMNEFADYATLRNNRAPSVSDQKLQMLRICVIIALPFAAVRVHGIHFPGTHSGWRRCRGRADLSRDWSSGWLPPKGCVNYV